MITVGLTGQIASGKSTVAKTLRQKGAIIIDADIIGHKLLESDETKVILQAVFGDELFSNNFVDRLKLAQIVFSSKESLDKLNNIMWPLITDYIVKALETLNEELPPSAIVVVEAALLFDAGWQNYLDVNVSVLANREIQVSRLLNNNYTKDSANARISMSSSQDEMIKKSDFVIYNNKNERTLEKEVENLWQFIKKARK